MFAAKPHPLIVPFDGTFDVRAAPTEPLKDKEEEQHLALFVARN